MTCTIVWHSSSIAHKTGASHPESPARLEAILDALREDACADIVEWVSASEAPFTALSAVHEAEHIARLQQVASRGGGALDADTVMSAGSWEAALYAAGAAIRVAQLALDHQPAFAAVRPPGHHATAAQAMGFCLLNNVAIAARYAIDELALQRVLIVDWDVHHGNGTQDIFGRDPRVRYVSLHQSPLYPGTGAEEETGVGNIFNVPRPSGLRRETYVQDLNDAVHRATDHWQPDLLLISAGFDAMAGDPLAGFTLEPEDYAAWIETWKGLHVPMGAVLEGGYAPHRIARAAVCAVRSLASSTPDRS
jgi:acetoin utilization deacetylase AcuC-like enzyme